MANRHLPKDNRLCRVVSWEEAMKSPFTPATKSYDNNSLSVNRRDLLVRSAVGVSAAGIAVNTPIHSVHAQRAKLAPPQTRTLEDWSYALAVNAATWGGPIVIMYALRNNDAVGPKVKAAPNNLWRMENI